MSPPTGSRQDLPGDDGLDDLLRSFYKAQVPDPWPSFAAPAERSVLPFAPAPRRRHPLLRSRLALAASVALLVACPWLLNGALQPAGVAEPDNAVVTVPPLTSPTANAQDGKAPVPQPAPKLAPMDFAPSPWTN